jgi:hypothetical protein
LSIFIPPIAPQSPSPIIWGWYNRPEVAAVPNGLSLIKIIIIIIIIIIIEYEEVGGMKIGRGIKVF